MSSDAPRESGQFQDVRPLSLLSTFNLQLSTRTLGRTELEVTALGLGCGSLGRQPDGSVDEEVARATVLAALDAGVRLIDTASLYLNGAAECIVGQALRERPALAGHVERLEAVCARHGVSLLAAALQHVVRHPVVAATIPGARRPEEARANAAAMREPVPPALWAELEPLLRSFDVALPPE
jgi:aryl-alcohol dehydrogenase-like predicted oxidoreductase